MAKTPVDQVLIRRALELVQRGWTVSEAAQAVGVARSCLYNHGVRAGGGR